MKKYCFCLLLCIQCTAFSFSQEQTVHGLVMDAKTKEPIPYAAIGILGQNIGTVSTQEGLFRLTLPSKFINDSLTFSEVAHVPKKVSISSLLTKENPIISLEEEVMQLRTVVITSEKKRRYEKLGVKPMLYWGSCYANFKGGAQIAQLMEANSYPVFLSKARIKIGENKSKKTKMRVRVLEKNENGLPGKDVFEGAFVNLDQQKGWVEVDLSYANLIFEEDFFVCFEFLNVAWQPTEGYFSIVCWETDSSTKQLVRNTSLGKWQYALPGQRHIYAIGAEVYEFQ